MAGNDDGGFFGAFKKTFSSATVKRASARREGEADEPQPESTELDEKFERFMDRIGVNDKQRDVMRALPGQQKWTLICQAGTQSTATTQQAPSHFVNLLKDNKGGGFTVKEAEALRVTLRYSPIGWLEEFVGLSGLRPFFQVFHSHLRKEKKSNDDLEIITIMVLCCKHLMNTKAGKDGIIGNMGAVEALGDARNYVSDVNQVVVFELLAALCLWSEAAHSVTLRSVENSFDDLVDMMLSFSTLPDLKTAVMTFFNSLVGGMQTAEQQEELRRQLCLDEVVEVMRARMARAPYFGDEKLMVQLDICSEWQTAEEEHSRMTNRDDLAKSFRKLGKHVQQFPHIQPVLNELLLHLTLLRREGGAGLACWQMVDGFVRSAAGTTATQDPLEMAQDACERMLDELADGNVSFKTRFADMKAEMDSLKRQKEILSGAIDKEGGGDSSAAIAKYEKLVDELRAENATLRKQAEAVRALDDIWFDPATFHPPPTTMAPPPPTQGGAAPAGDGQSAGGGPPPPPMPGGGGGPPPPPMPGGGGPPPPPMPGGGGGPPPPPMMNAGPPAKTKLKPKTKMKGLMWSKVNAKNIKDTVWSDVDDEKLYGELEKDTLESLFSAAKPKPKADKAAGEKSEKVKHVSLLDMKRSQNLSIMLSRFKDMSYDDIARGIVRLDPALLSLDNVAALHTFAPTGEEIDLVKEYVSSGGSVAKLAKPEQYIHAVRNIPALSKRLKCVLTRLSFEHKARGVMEGLRIVSSAVSEVRGSTRLKKFLEVTLAVGNYINGSTPRGGAFGFKMDSLRKLMDTRSGDGRTALTHYLATLFETKYKQLDNLLEDFPSLGDATRESVNQLRQDLTVLTREVEMVQGMLEGYSPIGDGDCFASLMGGFANSAKKKVDSMKSNMTKLTDDSKKMLKYFAEKESSDVQEFLASLYMSLSMIQRAKEENHARVEAEEKAKIAAERRKNMPKAKRGGAPVEGELPINEGKGLLDSLLGNMKTGRAFAERRKSSAGSALPVALDLRGALRKAPPRAPRDRPKPEQPSFLGQLRKRPAEERDEGAEEQEEENVVDFKGMLRKRQAPDPAESAAKPEEPAMDFTGLLKKRAVEEPKEEPKATEPTVDFKSNLRKAPTPTPKSPVREEPVVDFTANLRKVDMAQVQKPREEEQQPDFRAVLSPRSKEKKDKQQEQ